MEKLFSVHLAIVFAEGINHNRISAFLIYRDFSSQVFKVFWLFEKFHFIERILRASYLGYVETMQ